MGKMTCRLPRGGIFACCYSLLLIWNTVERTQGITLDVPNFNAPGLWTPYTQGTGPELINQTPFGFQALLPATATQSGALSFLAEYRSAFLIHGDFDVQVEYSLLTWPPGNGARLGITMTEWYGGNRVSHGVGNEVYHFGAGSYTRQVQTSDTSGKLRLTREGSIFSGYYWDSTSAVWVLLGSGVAPTSDFQLRIGAWGHDSSWRDQEVLVGFNTTKITADSFIGSRSFSVPEVASTGVLLGFSGIFLLAFAISGRSRRSWVGSR